MNAHPAFSSFRALVAQFASYLLTHVVSASIGFIVLSGVFFIIEHHARRHRPLIRKGWFTDLGYWFFTILIAKPVTKVLAGLPYLLLIAMGVISWDVLKTRAYTGFGPLSHQPLLLQAVEVCLLADLVGYWTHR